MRARPRVAALVLLAALLRPLAAAEDRWADLPAMPDARQEVGVTALGPSVYVLGGIDAARAASARADRYEAGEQRWYRVADLPRALHHMGAAAVAGRVYALGGLESGFRGVASCFRLDPALGEWEPVAPLPTARGAMGVAVLEGRIYALGGQFGSVDLADAAVYTPDAGAGRWDELPPLRVARNHLAAAAVAGTVIAISGRSALGLRAEVERYDFAAGAWVLARPIPTARGGSAAAAIGARVFVFGGEGNTGVAGGIFPQTEVYDAGTDQWEARADMSVPRHGIGAAVVGDRILLPGGGPVQGFGVTAAHTAYLPASSDLPSFRRGDASGDGVLDIGDALMMLRALFEGTALVCADAADTDDDGTLAIADAVRLLEFLFLGGPAPAPPFPGLDGDPTPDGLDCVSAGAAPEGR